MQEDFLHYVWKYQKFNLKVLTTFDGNNLQIIKVGDHNKNAGPDFFNSHLRIEDQLWAGNVEIHLKSSDWYVHNHEQDPNYDNVILHVVWENDSEIFRKDKTTLPTLELKGLVDSKLLGKYENLLLQKNQFINCEKDFPHIDEFIFNSWIERLYYERLEHKYLVIRELLEKSNNDWEAVVFKMLATNFGLKVNGDSFLSIAQSVDFSVIRKLANNPLKLEALLLGQAKLLEGTSTSDYKLQLNEEYQYLKSKFKLDNIGVANVNFFRLRPPNFPTIRLSQLANIYSKKGSLLSHILKANTRTAIQEIFNVSTSNYWQTHYTFGKETKFSKKSLSLGFIDLLIINTVLPIKFAYHKANGIEETENLISLIEEIDLENNTVIQKFWDLKKFPRTAKYSQALLHLKLNYCQPNNCLNCAIGNRILLAGSIND